MMTPMWSNFPAEQRCVCVCANLAETSTVVCKDLEQQLIPLPSSTIGRRVLSPRCNKELLYLISFLKINKRFRKIDYRLAHIGSDAIKKNCCISYLLLLF